MLLRPACADWSTFSVSDFMSNGSDYKGLWAIMERDGCKNMLAWLGRGDLVLYIAGITSMLHKLLGNALRSVSQQCECTHERGRTP
jgi:hypothetical protein